MVTEHKRHMCLALLLVQCLLISTLQEEHHEYVIGYLGASNDTRSANQILHMLQQNHSCGRQLNSELTNGSVKISVVHRVTDKCDVGKAVYHLFDMLNKGEELLALVLFSCTEVLKVVGELAPQFNLTVFGLGSSSAVLKNADIYPTLLLLSEVENTHSSARVHFIESQGWGRIGTLSEDYEDYTLAAESLFEATWNSSVTVEQALTVAPTSADINKKIEELSNKDIRIILLFGRPRVLEDILRSMASGSFLDAKRVLILNQEVENVPPEVDLFYIGPSLKELQVLGSASRCDYGPSIESLMEQVYKFLLHYPKHVNSMKEHFNKFFIYERNFTTSIYQYESKINQYDWVATVLAEGDEWMELIANISWPDGKKPVDKKSEVDNSNTIDKYVLYIFWALALIGIVLALSFFAIDCKYRNVGFIKLSSPILNSVTIVGAICLYAAVFALGLTYPRVSKPTFSTMCTLRSYLLSVGYSLVFGPMCAKAYRVHYIFTSSNHGKLTRKKLKDKYLLLFIGILIAMDTTIAVIWHLNDPFEIKSKRNLQIEKSDLDTTIYSVSYICSSKYVTKWLGIIYTYKGIILLFGVYLAWTTRRVCIPTLNDSKSIILNIYVVLGASILIVISSTFLQNNATLSYCIVGSLTLASTTVMLSILTVPKLISLWKLPHDIPNSHISCIAMKGTGLIASSNTKRLETNLSESIRELEHQNRVLEGELRELEKEITQLKTMSTRRSIHVMDFLAEDLLYIIPLSINCSPSDPVPHDPFSARLTRRHTPKYKIKRRKQKEMLQKYKTGDFQCLFTRQNNGCKDTCSTDPLTCITERGESSISSVSTQGNVKIIN